MDSKLLLKVELKDKTGSLKHVSCFEPLARKLLGYDGNEIKLLENENKVFILQIMKLYINLLF